MLFTQPRLLSRLSSYPRWVGATHAASPVVAPRPLLPLRPHPSSSPSPPPQPPRPALPSPPSAFERSLHAAPAAWPKTLAESSGSLSRQDHPFTATPPAGKESKEERAARIGSERDACMDLRLNADHWSVEDGVAAGQAGQWMSAERWRRVDPEEGGITLVLTHACGLQKEHWIPLLSELLDRDPAARASQFGGSGGQLNQTSVVVNDVWMLDDTHHAASVDLNAGRLGATHSWSDTGRDVLNFVEHVLPAIQGQDAPWELKWGEATKGRTAPQVVGIGHSYGASGLVQAAAARPDLFSSLFLIEPMCPPLMVNFPSKGYPLTLGALKRRSHWPSRDSAAEAVRNNPMFKSWDDAVFSLWLSHSLVPSDPSNPDGAVELATPTWAEAAVFSDPHSTLRGWDLLAQLEMPTGFLMAGDEVWMAGEEMANEMVWRPKRSRNERLLDSSHLIVQEKPKDAADSLWRFLATLQAGTWDKQ